ncbi:hypothetical protein HK098_006170 [Nowakowskiella sp. JEL0407]|nr:hypothetical protein HK098_006170 [Nowakowskiella sp. JEL0407]
MTNVKDLPYNVLDCLSLFFDDYESFENLFYTCKFFYEFGKDPVLRLRWATNSISIMDKSCVKIYYSVFDPIIRRDSYKSTIPRAIAILLSAESMCTYVANSELDFPFEILATTWYYSSIFGYIDANIGFLKNYEKNVGRFSNADFCFPNKNFHIQYDAGILLSTIAAYALKNAILKYNVEVARLYYSSNYVCEQISKLILGFQETAGKNLSPFLYIRTFWFPYMKEFLDKIPAYLSVNDGRGKTPLYRAVQKRNLRLVQLLLTYEQTDITAKSDNGRNSIHEACAIEDTDILGLLLTRVSNLSDLQSDLFLELAHYCIYNHYTVSLRFLLTSPKLNHGFTDCYSLLVVAAETDNVSAAEFLASSCPSAIIELRNKATTLFAKCAECGSMNLARFLLDLNLSAMLNFQDEHLNTPLHYAKHNFNLTKLYLDNGADPFIPDMKGMTIYHYFFKRQFREIINVLIALHSHAVNVPDRDGTTSLGISVNSTDVPLVDLLLGLGADPQVMWAPSNSGFQRILELANHVNVSSCHIFSSLLAFGLDPNTCVAEEDGATQSLLHVACQAQAKEVIETLLAFGANPYVLDSNDNTTVSVVADNLELTKLLITGISELRAQEIRETASERFKNSTHQPRPMFPRFERTTTDDYHILQMYINQQDDKGNTALHKSSYDVAEYLLSLGADPNIQNFDGDTVLHYKIREGVFNSIIGILKFSPDPTIVNFDGLSACDLALSLGLEESHWLIPALMGEEFEWKDQGYLDEILPWNNSYGFNLF